MNKQKLYIETYGCQMNFADSEIVASILSDDFEITSQEKEADLILVNTCSIRDNAEQRVFNRMKELIGLKKSNKNLKVGLIGCMAERLQEELLNTMKVDLVVGPDAYRNLPDMLRNHTPNVNVILSEVETYENISPIRYDSNGISAFVSIMRGCNNFCSYCVVPYTRGRERSRNITSILDEIRDLFQKGYREVTLLGQNVNSYNFEGKNFAYLIQKVAEINPLLRVRFATSHPKDLSDELLQVMTKYNNICKSIHLPAQSGSSTNLKRMNRKYTREWYLDRVESIRKHIPDCAISTDIIAGFCGETEEEHKETLSLMQEVGYEYAFMFKYSMREGTYAHKHLIDNIAENIKTRRLEEIITLQQQLSLQSNQKDIGKTFEVLIEGTSKRSQEHLFGRNSQNKVVIFPKGNLQKGDYVQVKITSCSAATLFGDIV